MATRDKTSGAEAAERRQNTQERLNGPSAEAKAERERAKEDRQSGTYRERLQRDKTTAVGSHGTRRDAPSETGGWKLSSTSTSSTGEQAVKEETTNDQPQSEADESKSITMTRDEPSGAISLTSTDDDDLRRQTQQHDLNNGGFNRYADTPINKDLVEEATSNDIYNTSKGTKGKQKDAFETNLDNTIATDKDYQNIAGQKGNTTVVEKDPFDAEAAERIRQQNVQINEANAANKKKATDSQTAHEQYLSDKSTFETTKAADLEKAKQELVAAKQDEAAKKRALDSNSTPTSFDTATITEGIDPSSYDESVARSLIVRGGLISNIRTGLDAIRHGSSTATNNLMNEENAKADAYLKTSDTYASGLLELANTAPSTMDRLNKENEVKANVTADLVEDVKGIPAAETKKFIDAYKHDGRFIRTINDGTNREIANALNEKGIDLSAGYGNVSFTAKDIANCYTDISLAVDRDLENGRKDKLNRAYSQLHPDTSSYQTAYDQARQTVASRQNAVNEINNRTFNEPEPEVFEYNEQPLLDEPVQTESEHSLNELDTSDEMLRKQEANNKVVDSIFSSTDPLSTELKTSFARLQQPNLTDYNNTVIGIEGLMNQAYTAIDGMDDLSDEDKARKKTDLSRTAYNSLLEAQTKQRQYIEQMYPDLADKMNDNFSLSQSISAEKIKDNTTENSSVDMVVRSIDATNVALERTQEAYLRNAAELPNDEFDNVVEDVAAKRYGIDNGTINDIEEAGKNAENMNIPMEGMKSPIWSSFKGLVQYAKSNAPGLAELSKGVSWIGSKIRAPVDKLRDALKNAEPGIVKEAGDVLSDVWTAMTNIFSPAKVADSTLKASSDVVGLALDLMTKPWSWANNKVKSFNQKVDEWHAKGVAAATGKFQDNRTFQVALQTRRVRQSFAAVSEMSFGALELAYNPVIGTGTFTNGMLKLIGANLDMNDLAKQAILNAFRKVEGIEVERSYGKNDEHSVVVPRIVNNTEEAGSTLSELSNNKKATGDLDGANRERDASGWNENIINSTYERNPETAKRFVASL